MREVLQGEKIFDFLKTHRKTCRCLQFCWLGARSVATVFPRPPWANVRDEVLTPTFTRCWSRVCCPPLLPSPTLFRDLLLPFRNFDPFSASWYWYFMESHGCNWRFCPGSCLSFHHRWFITGRIQSYPEAGRRTGADQQEEDHHFSVWLSPLSSSCLCQARFRLLFACTFLVSWPNTQSLRERKLSPSTTRLVVMGCLAVPWRQAEKNLEIAPFVPVWRSLLAVFTQWWGTTGSLWLALELPSIYLLFLSIWLLKCSNLPVTLPETIRCAIFPFWLRPLIQ